MPKELVDRFRQLYPNATCMSQLPDRSKDKNPVVPRTKKPRTGRSASLRLILLVYTHFLDIAVFRTGDKILRQIRGNPIGGLMSAIFGIMTVALPELKFHESLYTCAIKPAHGMQAFVPGHPQRLSQMVRGSDRGVTWAVARYVDNRLIAHLGPEYPLDTRLCHPDFYKAPVKMVKEPGYDYMELALSVVGGQVQGRFRTPSPKDNWRYITHTSATSDRALRGVCMGRLIAAATMAFPLNNQQRAAQELFRAYKAVGISAEIRHSLAVSMRKRYRKIYTPEIVQTLGL